MNRLGKILISKKQYCEATMAGTLRLGRMVRPAGFEPTTSCSGGKRSIQLSYGRPR